MAAITRGSAHLGKPDKTRPAEENERELARRGRDTMKLTMTFPTVRMCTTRLPLRSRSERFGGDGRAQGAARARPRGGIPLLLHLCALTLFAPFALSACDSTNPYPTESGGLGGDGGSTPEGCVPSLNADPVGEGPPRRTRAGDAGACRA